MIRHVVMLRFTDTATTEEVQAVSDALDALPGEITQLRSYVFGPDAGLAEGNWDFVVVADFDNEDDYRTYSTHPAHIAAITDHIKPILAERAAVQYRI